MRARRMIVLATTVVLTAGLTANANAFSGGVSHVVTHPVAVMANPGTEATAAASRGIMRAQTRIVPGIAAHEREIEGTGLSQVNGTNESTRPAGPE
jgi:hypothetical protein